MTVKELFDFVTDPTVTESNVDDYLDKAMKIATTRVITETEKVDDEVSFQMQNKRILLTRIFFILRCSNTLISPIRW